MVWRRFWRLRRAQRPAQRAGGCTTIGTPARSMKPRIAIITLLFSFLYAADQKPAPEVAWPAYGGGPEDIRYSSLKQINRTTVTKLKVAWSYDTADGSGDPQTQPIMVNGVLFGLTPKHKPIALAAATGKLLWKFEPPVTGRGPNRSVVYWSNGADRRIFAAVQSYLYALNAVTGRPIATFGNQGRIDLRADLSRPPEQQSIVLTSPGIIYKDLLIIGGRTPEALPAPLGDVRAYD